MAARRPPVLLGRAGERATLDRLLENVRGCADALQRLAQATTPSGTEWALGVEARARALLSEGEAAEDRFRADPANPQGLGGPRPVG